MNVERNSLDKIKDGACVILMIKIVKEHIGFYYLLTEIYTLILLELNTFLNKY